MTILLITPTQNRETTLTSFLESHFSVVKPLQNPDVHWVNEPDVALAIEQVRDLAQSIVYVPYTSSTQFYILQQLERASVPAQNALLKIIEEPPAQTQIILTCQDTTAILPTILSRVVITDLASQAESQLTPEVALELQEFYSQLTTVSSSELIALAEKDSDRIEARRKLHLLVLWLHQRLLASMQTGTVDAKLGAQYTAHLTYLLDAIAQLNQNLNVKLVLENCYFNIHRTSHS